MAHRAHYWTYEECGFDTDIVRLTNEENADPRAFNPLSWFAPSAMRGLQQRLPEERMRHFIGKRGKLGVCCERPECEVVEIDPRQSSMKRCSQCRQVLYCGRECQKLDWPRHKRVCVAPDDESTDQTLRLARHLIGNPATRIFVLHYVCTCLHTDRDPLAGLKNRFIFTCTTIPDPSSPSTRMLQIASVRAEATPIEVVGRLRAEVNIKEPGSIGIQLVFGTDNPNIAGAYQTLETADANIIPFGPDGVLLKPVWGLTTLNNIIRQDVDNFQRLRASS